MAKINVNGNSIPFEPGATILEAARARASTFRRSAGIPSSPSSPTAGSAWFRSRARASCCRPALPPPPKAWWSRPSPRPQWTTAAACSVSCSSAIPATHLQQRGPRPRPATSSSATSRSTTCPVRAHHELPLRAGDERPGDVMIQHDMSTCILCTRCVRACEDIQEVGVLDVGDAGRARADHRRAATATPTMPAAPGAANASGSAPPAPSSSSCPSKRFGSEAIRDPDRVVRSVCPYCGVGCQIDLHVKDDAVMRVTSPWIEERTPNQGSTCVKGRFGYDFPQHRDRLTRAADPQGLGAARTGAGSGPASGPGTAKGRGSTIEEMGERQKPQPARSGSVGKPPLTGLPLLRRRATCATGSRRRRTGTAPSARPPGKRP